MREASTVKITTPEAAHLKAIKEGQAIREKVPRNSHATWRSSLRKSDGLKTLLATGKHRLAPLLPLRYGRMSQSPFSYYRGAAAVMATDLARTPISGIRVQTCGDCHVTNFGAFASPERRVLFDITDFDETLQAPWEFDLKRLAVSFILLSRIQGCSRTTCREVTLTVLRSYRQRLREFAFLSPLETWYSIIDSEILIRTAPDAATRNRRVAFEKKARARSGESLLGRIVEQKRGKLQFIEQPPVLTRLKRNSKLETSFRTALRRYPMSLSEDRRFLLSRYQLESIAFKVVGVGSVGTRCGVALYLSETNDPLLLQVKEALPSVLEPVVGKSRFAHEGKRVVVGQRLMQCASDIFLGWANDDDGHQYYIRQLRDMKTSVPLEALQGQVLFNFADMCGWALARAHSKAGDAPLISGYIGNSERLDQSIADFAVAYADQCEKDYDVFIKAIRSGKIPIEKETET